MLLPHLGSATDRARRGMWELAWDNLLRGVRFQALRNPVLPGRDWSAGAGEPD